MGAVLFRLRTEARRAWLGWVAFGLLFALVAGAAIAAIAGARRTETAYDRFLRATEAFDVLVANGGTTPDNLNRQFDFDEVKALPQVVDAARIEYYLPLGGRVLDAPVRDDTLSPFASPDGRFGSVLNRYRVLEGRLPEGEHDVALSRLVADRTRLGVGDSLDLVLGDATAFQSEGPPPEAERFHVVGLVATQVGFPPGTGGLPPPMVLSRAYVRAHPEGTDLFALRLRDGARDAPDVEEALAALAHGEAINTTNGSEQTAVVQRGLDVQAAVLRLLAFAAAAVGVLLIGQGMARRAYVDANDHRALRAVGFGWSDLFALGAARAAVVAAVATAATPMIAIALSPLTPIGVARDAELHPGFEVNVAHLAAGTSVTAVVVLAVGLFVTWRALRLDPAGTGAPMSNRLARAASSGASSPVAGVGIGLALDPGRGRNSVPLRATLAGAAVGVATLVAVATFASSIRHLFNDPALYGWNWDVQIGDSFAPDLSASAAQLRTHPDVAAVASATTARVRIGDLTVDILGIDGRSTVRPVVVEGRVPRAASEIVLGTRTLHRINHRVGDRIAVRAGTTTRDVRVVGRGVFAQFGGSGGFGDGGAMTLDGARQLSSEAEADVILVRLRPGVRTRAFLAHYQLPGGTNRYLPNKPSDLRDLERVGGLPSVVAGALALVAVGTLGHVLLTSVRRRRREFAVLKTLGFVRRQVAGAMAWQASVLAVLAALIGVPLGLVAGRWAWIVFAYRLGVPARPVLPIGAALAVLPATVLLANVVAAGPAWLAGRTQPAVVLRTD